jgi:hypothetical protein
MYRKHLVWRKEFKTDEIRNKIASGGLNDPNKFPKGELIISLAPQIVISPSGRDKLGQPIQMEQYNFSPTLVFENITMDEYIRYLIHTMEFRSLILEQLSDEIEQRYLLENPDPKTRVDGYGVILKICCIRDLKGVGLSHMTPKAKLLIQRSLAIATANYQEFLGKSHMINVPWVFNTLWYIIKGWIEPSTLAKVSLSGSEYMKVLLIDIPATSIPEACGGGMEERNGEFDFSQALLEGGSLYCKGVSAAVLSYKYRPDSIKYEGGGKFHQSENDANSFKSSMKSNSKISNSLKRRKRVKSDLPVFIPTILPVVNTPISGSNTIRSGQITSDISRKYSFNPQFTAEFDPKLTPIYTPMPPPKCETRTTHDSICSVNTSMSSLSDSTPHTNSSKHSRYTYFRNTIMQSPPRSDQKSKSTTKKIKSFVNAAKSTVLHPFSFHSQAYVDAKKEAALISSPRVRHSYVSFFCVLT